MCLQSIDLERKPCNQLKIRWKVIKTRRDENKSFLSPHKYMVYNKTLWNHAKGNKARIEDFGFHVFVTRKDAREYIQKGHKNNWFDPDSYKYMVKKIHVEGFLQSGYYGGWRCETWQRMKFANSAKKSRLFSNSAFDLR